MRTLTAAVLAVTLVASNAFAAVQSTSLLPAGKPAGVKKAEQLGPNMLLILAGLGIVIGGIALTVSDSGNGLTTNTTTTTTTTTTGTP